MQSRASLRRSASQFAREILDQPEYKQRLMEDARAGILDTKLAIRLMEYAWGAPPRELIVSTPEDELWAMSKQETLARIEEIRSRVASRVIDEHPSNSGESLH